MTFGDWMVFGTMAATLVLTAWYKGVFGRMFRQAPISTLPTSVEETASEYHYVKGARLAMQEAHDEAARRLATKQRQEVIDSILPPLSPGPAGGSTVVH